MSGLQHSISLTNLAWKVSKIFKKLANHIKLLFCNIGCIQNKQRLTVASKIGSRLIICVLYVPIWRNSAENSWNFEKQRSYLLIWFWTLLQKLYSVIVNNDDDFSQVVGKSEISFWESNYSKGPKKLAILILLYQSPITVA